MQCFIAGKFCGFYTAVARHGFRSNEINQRGKADEPGKGRGTTVVSGESIGNGNSEDNA